MVFKKEESTGKSIALILKDGNTEIFDCSFSSCTNPVCTCKSIDITFTSLQDENQNGRALPSHRVDIDLTEKKLNSESEDKRLSKDLAFENLVLSQLNCLNLRIRLPKRRISIPLRGSLIMRQWSRKD
jgi:hypothetical protein